ncbi:hypothetical protein [Burkholderia multivorans]|uniref:hypothetical protein n=1 Tax=Burkholderia multivorans TaxID=87883 RepID=UPI00209E4B49|nr:hypothetical protein [Burkholderia multivorans]MCO8590375.1 hypothetical protein [Burkholderia multivorans]MCO8632650.1 hypothetical protein [Burkholderia multivorans]MCO8647213.1 hypothetical protein [Burkholderia multivorans]
MLESTENYGYELIARPAQQGGGWLLRLLLNGRELGRRVFPPVAGIDDEQLAVAAAHDDALARVTAWLSSIEARPSSMRPKPADESGTYLLMPDDELLCPQHAVRKRGSIVVEWPDERQA